MRLTAALNVLCFLAGFCSSLPVQDVVEEAAHVSSELPRLVIYFQTTHDSGGNPISMLPLVTEQGIALTHLIVCSFHINLGSVIHLNDYPPDYPLFYTLWNETVIMKEAGVKVMGMIGGAAAGSFNSQTLDSTNDTTFELYYGQLHDLVVNFGLQGMDLDVEQRMSQAGVTRLVQRLYADFGDDFIITLAPVASALRNGGNLSGFDYETLDAAAVTTGGLDMVDFYNAQFYNGFGSLSTSADFDKVVANGWDPTRILGGQVTSPSNGYGYVDFPTLNATVIELVEEYGQIGGIMGWEYFNSEPGGTAEPWLWAEEMTEILRPNETVNLNITSTTATVLDAAWKTSVIKNSTEESALIRAEETQRVPISSQVDYFAMVNV